LLGKVSISITIEEAELAALNKIADGKFAGNRSRAVAEAIIFYSKNHDSIEEKVETLDKEIRDEVNSMGSQVSQLVVKYSELDLSVAELRETMNQIQTAVDQLSQKSQKVSG